MSAPAPASGTGTERSQAQPLEPRDEALVELGRRLRDRGYAFTTVTPLTHQRVNARPENAQARSLVDIFGWSRPFSENTLAPDLRNLLQGAGQLVLQADGRMKSAVRFSTLEGLLIAHSAFPTEESDSVFLGPDTSRFLSLLKSVQPTGERLVEVGSGTGVAGLFLAPRFATVVLCDINDRAVQYSRLNAALAGIDTAEVLKSDVLREVQGEIDCVIANPPYLVDARGRTYRHGGNELGTELALRIVEESLSRLRPGGTLVLYTGSPVVDGKDVFQAGVLQRIAGRTSRFEYREIDPDIFGEELETPAYRCVERFAAVAVVATRSGG